MNKHMPPPLKMKVERGRLVPATQYDSERLDSYRVGSTVNVRFTADRVRPLERKYRAILGKVIKECKTPWSNAEAAHQAIKLSCGIVNYGKTAGGDFFQWPRSLVDLDDKEMEEFFESAMGVIQYITGIAPETLKREAANVGDENEHIDPETGEITNTNPGDQSPPDQPEDDATAQTAALSQEPSKDSSPDDGSNGEPAANPEAPKAAAGSSSDHQKWLLNIARMLWVIPNTGGDLDLLDTQREAALISFPKPEGLPKAIDEKAKAVFRRCQEVISRSLEPHDALALIAGNVGVDQDDILKRAGS